MKKRRLFLKKICLQKSGNQKKSAFSVKFQNLSLKEAVQNLEKKLLIEHLQKQQGNKTQSRQEPWHQSDLHSFKG